MLTTVQQSLVASVTGHTWLENWQICSEGGGFGAVAPAEMATADQTSDFSASEYPAAVLRWQL